VNPRNLIIVMISALFMLGLPSVSQAKIKSGMTCSPLGKSTVTDGKRFTCVKSGKKKIWNKGVIVPQGKSVTLRLTSPILNDVAGSPSDYVNATGFTSTKKWISGAGPSSAAYYRYADVGTFLEVSWRVSDSATGVALANKNVWLVANANASGAQKTKFKYEIGSDLKFVQPNYSGTQQTQIPGVTDANGNVTFTLQNTNSIAQAEPAPRALNVTQAPQNISLFSNFTLTTHASARSETRDYLLTHFIKPNDKILWADEFSGGSKTAPVSSSWNTVIGDGCDIMLCGWGNNEREYYTQVANRVDGNGNLVISTKLLSRNTTLSCYPDSCQYTSGRINTRDKVTFQYGLIEGRMKLPEGGGTWPAFWMLGTAGGWPMDGEIDIMEATGNDPNRVLSTVHTANANGNHSYDGSFIYGPNPFSAAFHTYSVAWKPNQMDFYVDGELIYTSLKRDVGSGYWPFNAPFYMILNNAMGGGLGGEVAWDFKSSTMSIDYVRAYEYGRYGCVTTATETIGACS